MAVGTIGNFAVNSLEFFEFFDPDARLIDRSSTEISLGSPDGYELVIKGDGFEFGKGDVPKDGTITEFLLYDPAGNLVGKIDDVSYSLVDYYQTVVEDGKSEKFTADLLSGDDDLAGGGARDRLEGYDGDDKISGGFGADTILGDAGDDTLNGGSGGDDISGGSGADVINGNTGQDLVYGGSGDDVITGGDASDRLSGDGGNDNIEGNNGFDSIAGGAGDDTIDGGAQGDDIEAGDGDDVVDGGAADDNIGGGAGDDVLTGGNGLDLVFGDDGNDSLRGDSGDDRLSGGAGADTLVGGDGVDTLFGGGGDDRFLFEKQTQGADVILDFDRGEDVLAFKASGFDNLDANFDLVTGKNPEANSGDGTFLFNTKTHELFWDSNGDGKGQETLVAVLDGVKDLDKGDFLIV